MNDYYQNNRLTGRKPYSDMHSLAAFGTTLALKDQNVPWHPEEVPLEQLCGSERNSEYCRLYSVLLEGHAPAAGLFELFPGILKGIFISFEDRLQIADLIHTSNRR